MRNEMGRAVATALMLTALPVIGASPAAAAKRAKPAPAPAAATAKGADAACGCKHVRDLQAELRNALTLKARHAAKAEDLRRRFGEMAEGKAPQAAREDYLAFETGKGAGSAAEGIVGTVKDAPAAIAYTPRGLALQEAHSRDDRKGIAPGERWTADGRLVPDPDARRRIEAEQRDKGEDLCDHQDKAAVEASARGSATCAGIYQATIRHEEAHQATCRRLGYYAFAERTPIALAQDEVRAYEVQIAALGAELQRVLALKQTRIRNKPLAGGLEGLLAADAGCVTAVNVSGRIDELTLKGKVCDTAEPAKLVGNYPIDFQLTPKDETSGTYAYNGRAAGATFYGSGGYRYELGENGSGDLLLDGAGRWYVKHPLGVSSKGGPERLKATGLPEGCS